MKTKVKIFCLFFFLLASYINTSFYKLQNETNIDNFNDIVFGQSIYETGSLKLYGEIIKNGILACFNKTNEEGGIQGKKLKLISMDDKGIPIVAAKNIKIMLTQDNINMFIGNMGTRSILKILPLIKSKKIALFFPWGGDEELRTPNLTNIINGPGFIKTQIEALAYEIAENMRFTKIAIFHEDSDFYKEIANETLEILKKYNLIPIKVESFNRFTLNITLAANRLIKADPKIVILLCTNTPATKLISHFFENGYFGTTFFGIDSTFFVGQILHDKGANFYYTAAVPNPLNRKIPIVEEYQESLKKFFPKETPNILSLTYYISAKIIVEALKKIEGKITKEKLIDQIEMMKNYNLKGFTVNFNPETRQAFGQTIEIIKG